MLDDKKKVRVTLAINTKVTICAMGNINENQLKKVESWVDCFYNPNLNAPTPSWSGYYQLSGVNQPTNHPCMILTADLKSQPLIYPPSISNHWHDNLNGSKQRQQKNNNDWGSRLVVFFPQPSTYSMQEPIGIVKLKLLLKSHCDEHWSSKSIWSRIKGATRY